MYKIIFQQPRMETRSRYYDATGTRKGGDRTVARNTRTFKKEDVETVEIPVSEADVKRRMKKYKQDEKAGHKVDVRLMKQEWVEVDHA